MSFDPTSLSNYTDIKVKHISFELDIDFNSKIVEGYAELEAEVLKDGVSELRLDTRDLTVLSASLPGDGSSAEDVPFKMLEHDAILGTPLSVTLPSSLPRGRSVSVGVRFRTSPSSSALQFMKPEQTAGGKYPFLFSQCETIHARSLTPCQDTPAVKCTYSASVRVPRPLQALMSALPVTEEQGAGGTLPHVPLPAGADPAGFSTFSFRQGVPIPIYLLALAAGRLESRELGSRSRVWAEPETVEAAAFEFAETSKFLETGERLAGTPYVWGRYDLLVMPPSFPYGGMENPGMTFVTPTLLVGDRSLTNVVAHEISHSWTGNLVTNATWEHFWLNEGWTRLLETKIIGELQGAPTQQFLAVRSEMTMEAEIDRLGPSNPFTQLVWDLKGRDPDDAFSSVPYEKGLYFLHYLQALVGGPAEFNPFVQHYVASFKFSTVDSEQFKKCFLDFFAARGHEGGKVFPLESINWDAWLNKPGRPPAKNTYDDTLVRQSFDLAQRWSDFASFGAGGGNFSPNDLAGWSTEQVVAFLEKLASLRGSNAMQLYAAKDLAKTYDLLDSRNPEIRVPYYKLALASGDLDCVPHVVQLLKAQGRMKYIRPLYREMFRQPLTRSTALEVFQEVRHTYHPIAEKMVAADLGLS